MLEQVRTELRAAAWFAALGEPLTDGDRADADAYAKALGLGTSCSDGARWPEAERVLKSPDWSPLVGSRRRTAAMAAGESRSALSRACAVDLAHRTHDRAGDLVHGKAGIAAARMGGAAKASIHVAAGAAAQAVYQLALARLAEDAASPFESKFRLFAAGRWPLGVVGSTLVLF